MKKIFLFLLLSAFCFACHDGSKAVYDGEAMAEIGEEVHAVDIPAKKMTANAGVGRSEIQQERKIIWSANVEFQVKNVDQSTSRIGELSRKHGAFISDMNLTSNNYRIANRIVIRVESSRFDSLLNDLKSESVSMKNIKIKSQDVTEEFIDIQIRLKTKKEVRERYIQILRDKTGNIRDVIEAEEAIRKITEEIEAKEGRFRYLKDQIKFSTITLNIFQEIERTEETYAYVKPYSEKLAEGFVNGWSIVTSLLLAMVNIWPLLIIAVVLVWKRKWLASKIRRKNASGKS
ncbi:DUF4349 domain-containing protein [Aureibacter tunicatorum]|uniref:DUF4349 domain-containing protein n=1 Tax=Aureibacter tunicatorum TaxID=866807 RepID=A0AAE3XRJ1_9BACT|nr:DUF4349 domain-containing protein [Aureibacter tunicatorum]MDR6240615.1 hypothetical protein [Aureibacter tunicatorum]BDD06524.1 hypothetical protein AUTU_40070 [Aureibacter tunicatorum]